MLKPEEGDTERHLKRLMKSHCRSNTKTHTVLCADYVSGADLFCPGFTSKFINLYKSFLLTKSVKTKAEIISSNSLQKVRTEAKRD